MFIKIGNKIFNTNNITEIYAETDGRFTVYFNSSDGGDDQAHSNLTADEYERLMHALEVKNLLYVA